MPCLPRSRRAGGIECFLTQRPPGRCRGSEQRLASGRNLAMCAAMGLRRIGFGTTGYGTRSTLGDVEGNEKGHSVGAATTTPIIEPLTILYVRHVQESYPVARGTPASLGGHIHGFPVGLSTASRTGCLRDHTHTTSGRGTPRHRGCAGEGRSTNSLPTVSFRAGRGHKADSAAFADEGAAATLR